MRYEGSGMLWITQSRMLSVIWGWDTIWGLVCSLLYLAQLEWRLGER